jgi:hypothetical protein
LPLKHQTHIIVQKKHQTYLNGYSINTNSDKIKENQDTSKRNQGKDIEFLQVARLWPLPPHRPHFLRATSSPTEGIRTVFRLPGITCLIGGKTTLLRTSSGTSHSLLLPTGHIGSAYASTSALAE